MTREELEQKLTKFIDNFCVELNNKLDIHIIIEAKILVSFYCFDIHAFKLLEMNKEQRQKLRDEILIFIKDENLNNYITQVEVYSNFIRFYLDTRIVNKLLKKVG